MKNTDIYDGSQAAKDRLKLFFEVQKEQLDEWEQILKPEAFDHLNRKVQDSNLEVLRNLLSRDTQNLQLILRGTDLDNIVGNYKINLPKKS